MRITKLYIKSFKNLQDFTWELNPEYPVAVIVGKNASGKSNLLEAILLIFAQVRTDKIDKKFHFEVVYQDIDRNEIVFRNDEKGFFATRNGNAIDPNRVFPKQIVSYYAGVSQRMGGLIGEYRKKKESTKDLDIVYIQTTHYKFALLALLGSDLERSKLLLGKLEIEKIDTFQIKIQQPYNKLSQTSSRDNYWSAPPNLALFFETLYQNSKGLRKEKVWKTEGLILDFDAKGITGLIKSYYENQLFEYLSESLSYGFIRDVDITFKKKGVDDYLIFEDLSEGEKQKIGMRGTIELFLGNETLFLLDEPDAFAHPRWQWEFVPDLHETLGDSLSSQVIFVTHSPLVLSTVKDNAFVMENGKIEPLYGIYGEDVSMSLARMDTDDRLKEVDDKIALYKAMIQDGNIHTDSAKQLKAELVEELGINHSAIIALSPLETLYE
jgi:predicted ATPase